MPVEAPERADAIVICDFRRNLGQTRKAQPRKLLALLRHSCLIENRARCWRAKGAAACAWFQWRFSSSAIFEHYGGALEDLLPHCANETTLGALERQLPELLSLVLGTPSPRRVEIHRRAISAIRARREPREGC